MKEEYTPLLLAARDKGCTVQVGTDMLFEMIPAYLEFFGFGDERRPTNCGRRLGCNTDGVAHPGTARVTRLQSRREQ